MSQPPAMADRPSGIDDKELRILARLHYLLAGITAVCALPGVLPLVWGFELMRAPAGSSSPYRPASPLTDPVLWGATLVMFGVLWTVLALLHGGVLAYVGRLIARRRRRTLCLVFSAFDLTYFPLGTALGIYALVVLLRPEVKQQFL